MDVVHYVFKKKTELQDRIHALLNGFMHNLFCGCFDGFCVFINDKMIVNLFLNYVYVVFTFNLN